MSTLELAYSPAILHLANTDTTASEISSRRISELILEQVECYSTTDLSDSYCYAESCGEKSGYLIDALNISGTCGEFYPDKNKAISGCYVHKSVTLPTATHLRSIHLHNRMAQTVMNPPTKVEYDKMKFLILDAPSNENLLGYIKEMKNYGVTDLVRTCESTYDDSIVAAAGIRVHEMVFPDGEPPAESIILQWMSVVSKSVVEHGAVAVHCVAGLGRAPVLVAVALIEYGMGPMDAIMYVRDRRKGAINRRQLQFLRVYKSRLPRKKWCMQKCTIM